MTMRNKNKDVGEQFERFKQFCPDIPQGKAEIWEATPNDPPDVWIGDNVLGIEFRDFYHGEKPNGGSEQKAIETTFDKIIHTASDQFSQQSDILLQVSPVWYPHRLPPKSEIISIIQALVELISDSVPSYYHELIKLQRSDFVGTPLRRYLFSISIMKLKSGFPSWGNTKSGHPEIGVKDLESRVREKENGLPRWKREFKNRWLVIVADMKLMSSTVIPDHDVKPGCIVSTFDRVYLLNTWDSRLICLTEEKTEQGS